MEANVKLLSKSTVQAFIQDLEIVYLQSLSWLQGYPSIVAKNDPNVEADLENLAKLEKEKEKIESNVPEIEEKIVYFKSIIEEIERLDRENVPSSLSDLIG